jgi:hypothetical protein
VSYDWKTDYPGVVSRHADDCPVRDGFEDTCGPLGYSASVRDWATNRRTLSPTFATLEEALAWQHDQTELAWQRSQPAAPSRQPPGDEGTEVGALIGEYIRAVEDGSLRNGGGQPYNREATRALRGALSYVDSELGAMPVQDVRRRHIQALVDQLGEAGVATERVDEVVDALSALYAYAIRRELVGFSPVVEIEQATANGAAAPRDVPRYAPPAPPAAGWTTGDIPSLAPPVGPPWTPAPFDAAGRMNADYATSQWPQQPATLNGWQAPPPAPYTPYPGYPSQPQQPTGPLSAIFGSPTGADANYDATMQERWLWWTVRIVVIVFVLIALVLAAESV